MNDSSFGITEGRIGESMKNMTLSAITQACGGIYYGPESLQLNIVKDICIDSRKAGQGSLFIAIRGEHNDGHDFIPAVYEAGGICCLGEDTPKEYGSHPYIQVKSSLQALKDIASYYRSILDIQVVGITGSVGKTSTKECVAAVLSQKYRVLKTDGNFNNEIGLPLTIFRLREEDEIAVLEMGISDFGEMTRLAEIARPDVCIITNIGFCHLENLKTRDGILKAKTEIFTYMKKNASVILNGDDDKLITIGEINGHLPFFYGIQNNKKTYCYADKIINKGLEGIQADFYMEGEDRFEVFIPVPGHHMIYNALAASVTGKLFGLSVQEIQAGLKSLQTISGRNHIIRKNDLILIDDCYNANPVSMKASIDVLDMAKGRKVCILGDMFELGQEEEKLHYEVGNYLVKKQVDLLITVGKLSKQIEKGVKEANPNRKIQTFHFDTREELLSILNKIIQPGDNILIKASHAMGFSKITEYLQMPKD